MLIERDRSQLLIIDVQERLLPAMTRGKATLANCVRLAGAAQHLGVPTTLTQQYPQGIGATVQPLADLCIGRAETFDKMTFSCARDSAIMRRLDSVALPGRRQIVMCGIEAHVCVLQGALDLRARGFDVFVVADAVASRTAASRKTALGRLERAGAQIVTTEMVIFEWLERAGTPDFKAMLGLIK